MSPKLALGKQNRVVLAQCLVSRIVNCSSTWAFIRINTVGFIAQKTAHPVQVNGISIEYKVSFRECLV